MHKTLLMLFLLLASLVQAQQTVRGCLSDAKTQKPIPYATVYVNGTSKGTISKSNGVFELSNVLPSDVVVFSHVSYQTKEISAQQYTGESLSIALIPRLVELGAVKVNRNNLREHNLRLFRNAFLGIDQWGQGARLLNEEVLQFRWSYETKRIPMSNQRQKEISHRNKRLCWAPDSSYADMDVPVTLQVSASAPLQVELPLLGYQLHVDLIRFDYEKTDEFFGYQCRYFGYYYFKPYPPEQFRRKMLRMREKAYYHSAHHFCRALYEGKLQQNGYRIIERSSDETGKEVLLRIPLDSMLVRTPHVARLTGLKDKKYHVLYFANRRGHPLNLHEKRGRFPQQSNLYVLGDTCIISNNGITPDGKLIFTPSIGMKKIGAALPEDYRSLEY